MFVPESEWDERDVSDQHMKNFSVLASGGLFPPLAKTENSSRVDLPCHARAIQTLGLTFKQNS